MNLFEQLEFLNEQMDQIDEKIFDAEDRLREEMKDIEKNVTESVEKSMEQMFEEDDLGNSEELERLNSELNVLRYDVNQKIQKVNIFKTKVTYRFEIENIEQFFESNSSFSTHPFYCGAIPWCCTVSVNNQYVNCEFVKYLAFHLVCQNPDKTNWSVATEFELRLVNLKKRTSSFCQNFVYTFKSQTLRCGLNDFISFKKLKHYLGGSNKVEFQIFLKVSQGNKSNESTDSDTD